MKRMHSDILAFAGVFLLLAAYLASALPALPAGTRPSSVLLAAAVLLSCSGILYFINERTGTGVSLFAPAIYLVLATARPGALCFTAFHAAVLLTAVSMHFYLLFNTVRPATDCLAAGCLALGAAALIEPPLLWLAPVLTLTSTGRAEEKMKFWVTALLTLTLPFFAWYGIEYLRGRFEPLPEVLSRIGTQMCTLRQPAFRYTDATLCRILLVALMTLLAIISTIRRSGTYKIAQFRASVCLTVLTLSFSLLTLLFYLSSAVPGGMLTALPAAPLLSGWISRPGQKKGTRTLLLTTLLVLLIERIACLLRQ